MILESIHALADYFYRSALTYIMYGDLPLVLTADFLLSIRARARRLHYFRYTSSLERVPGDTTVYIK